MICIIMICIQCFYMMYLQLFKQLFWKQLLFTCNCISKTALKQLNSKVGNSLETFDKTSSCFKENTTACNNKKIHWQNYFNCYNKSLFTALRKDYCRKFLYNALVFSTSVSSIVSKVNVVLQTGNNDFIITFIRGGRWATIKFDGMW